MLPAERLAEAFPGCDLKPGEILAAFKAAAPYLGYRASLVQLVDWLFRFTKPQDWQPGRRPIVWPSSALQAADLGITLTQTKRLNRQLAELGLVVMRDSPNGKRYGGRDDQDHIVEAYGFDPSPLGSRAAEFRRIADAGREQRRLSAKLKRRATVATRCLRQVLDTFEQLELVLPATVAHATVLLRETAAETDDLQTRVEALERAAMIAREALESALSQPPSSASDARKAANMCPKGHQNVPHYTATRLQVTFRILRIQ